MLWVITYPLSLVKLVKINKFVNVMKIVNVVHLVPVSMEKFDGK